jgi:hypothetical protein
MLSAAAVGSLRYPREHQQTRTTAATLTAKVYRKASYIFLFLSAPYPPVDSLDARQQNLASFW